ncbi:hypothetical protein [Streptomyces sp. NPDC002573]|uniref:hypothetical protein n=1 Tax=Streptomyces sp. NPDC002573 TaxID=3364651 RepID=UPI0036A82A68
MSDSTGRDWKRMKPGDFGHPVPKPAQDALFLVDKPDACGTDAFDGYGFGAVLWADQPDPAPNYTEHPTS